MQTRSTHDPNTLCSSAADIMSKRPTKHQKQAHNIFIDDQAVHSDKESEEEGE